MLFTKHTLRDELRRVQLLQGGKSRVQGVDVEFGLQREMIELGLHFQHLQFDEAAQGSKEVIALCGLGLRWRFLQRDILFQRFVVTLHLPAFVIACGEIVKTQRGIAAHQIGYAVAAIFVCEDLLGEKEWEVHAFKVDFLSGVSF